MARPAFFFCCCPDSALLQSRIAALLAARYPASGTVRRLSFWGDEGLVPAFWEHLTLHGLFAEAKALILRNAQNISAEDLRRLCAALMPRLRSAGDDPVLPVICLEGAFERGSPKLPAHILKLDCRQAAEERGWIDITPPLEARTMPAYLRAAAKERGLELSSAEAGRLAEILPPDAALIATELDKLALSADSAGRLPPEALRQIEHTQEIGIFELLNLIQQRGDPPAVWRRVLEDRLSGENMVFAFNAIVLREARTLWQLLAGESPYLPAAAASRKRKLAGDLGFSRVARIWELALQADKGIKSGERSPDQAFEMLTAELFRLFA